jgi:DNA-directed RNA polymerase subunit M/transcription elongation factor TFIIS
MSNVIAHEPLYEQLLEVPTLRARAREKCPNCGSNKTIFLDVSAWSGRFYSKCVECSWIFAEK